MFSDFFFFLYVCLNQSSGFSYTIQSARYDFYVLCVRILRYLVHHVWIEECGLVEFDDPCGYLSEKFCTIKYFESKA